ncbi:MAG: inositol monophosphatase family protein [Pseudomonadota bacterium]
MTEHHHELPSDYLQGALDAAAAAADVIREGYARDFDVQQKADLTPVTEVDIASEKAIAAVLRARFPDHGFYGEETGRSDADSDYLWLVDPIDGTKAFVRRYPFFSTQIALMYRGELIVGVSSAPLYGELAWAERDRGAFLNGERLTVSRIDVLEDAAVSLGNVHSLAGSDGWQALGRIVARCGRIRGYGDFLHYHLLAAGKIDLVIESDLNILDIAALSVIVNEAGGTFTDLDGGRIRLETRSVLAGNPALYERAAGMLHPAQRL